MNQTLRRGVTPVLIASALLFGTSDIHSTAAESTDQEVIVVYKNEEGKEAVETLSSQVDRELDSFDALSVTINAEELEQLESNPNIDYVERESTTGLLGETAQWNVQSVNAPQAWEEGYTGKGIKVAVIDSGVNASHNDLDIVKSVSFVDDDPATTTVDESSVVDQDGHGTHVAGVISANFGGDIVQGSDVAGVAPDVELYSLKAIATKEGNTLDIIEAIDWAIANDMDIINLSLGSGTHSELFEEAVDQAYEAGILVVGASGNDGQDTDVRYPAKYDSVVAVSSVNQQQSLSEFASIGPEVEFTAPGEPITSTYEDTYAIMGGTSQAAPHVSGFLALLMQKNPEMTAVELRQELKKYTTDLGPVGRDEKFGYGFIDYAVYDDMPPGEVRGVQLTEQQEDSFTIAWSNPANEDFQSVKVYLNGEYIGKTNAEFYKFDGLEASSDYSVEIRTVDDSGNESEGIQLNVATQVDLFTKQLAEQAAVIQDKLTNAPEQMNLWDIDSAELAIEQLNDPAMERLEADLEAYKQSIGLKAFDSVAMTPSKDLTVRFNTAMDEESFENRQVFVRNNGEFVNDIDVQLSEDGKALTISAPSGGYPSGDCALYIDSGVKGSNGRGLGSPVVMKFNL